MLVVAENVLAFLELDRELVAGGDVPGLAGPPKPLGFLVSGMARRERDTDDNETEHMKGDRTSTIVRRDPYSHDCSIGGRDRRGSFSPCQRYGRRVGEVSTRVRPSRGRPSSR